MTKIFTSKKLEKIIHKKIVPNDLKNEDSSGEWNATVFYIARKKCLLLVHAQTFFSVIIPRFSMKNIDNLEELIIENLHCQLLFEKIDINQDKVNSLIGEIKFHSTNNNRKIIGVLNYNTEKLSYFKYDYPVYNNLVIWEMTEKLNKIPFKQLKWSLPHEKMVDFLKR